MTRGAAVYTMNALNAKRDSSHSFSLKEQTHDGIYSTFTMLHPAFVIDFQWLWLREERFAFRFLNCSHCSYNLEHNT